MGAYTCEFGVVHKMCRCPTEHTIKCDVPAEHGPDSKRRSRHFAVGTDILCLGRRGTIVRVLHCKCPANETALHIRWDDDSMSIIEPHALNRGKPNHQE